MASKKLPPIDFTEDKQRYEAVEELSEVNLKRCKHKQVSFKKGQLVCVCGAAWAGPQLNKLYEALKSWKPPHFMH